MKKEELSIKENPNQPIEKYKENKPQKERKDRREKFTEKWEETRLYAYFSRLFEKYDIRNEAKFIQFGKWLIFIVLVFVELFILLQHFSRLHENGGWGVAMLLVGAEIILTLAEALTLFAMNQGKSRTVFFVVDAIAACALMFFPDGTFPIVIYMLVLTEFYFDATRTKTSMAVFLGGLLIYILSFGVRTFYLSNQAWDLMRLIALSFGGVFALAVHFVIVSVMLAFYRQFLKLDKTLKKLDESNRELEKAYARVAEVTALEERQRIAKEIHDTAGHSITTVIMQTEAAKLIIDSDKEAAKNKLIAANLQAKHALEELRDSVHLLSGMAEQLTLKMALESIIQESTDGTGVKIRSQIQDVRVGERVARFLCNSLKEGISNGLRHGKATAFWFELKEENGRLQFLLSDNGMGVQSKKLPLGFGLKTMRERAQAFGGEAEFVADIEEGFELKISLPMQEK